MLAFDVILIDLLYLFMNCDFDISEDEKKFLNEVIKDLDEDSQQAVKINLKRLDEIISKGLEPIREKTKELGRLYLNLPKEESEMQQIKGAFLTVIKNMIYADKITHDNEKILFKELCEVWNMDLKLE